MQQQRTLTPRVVVQVLLFVVAVPFLPLLISWRWDWWQAWAFGIMCVLNFATSRALVARRHPDLIAERSRFMKHEDAKPWDKVLAPLVGLGGALVPLAAGLDARFGGASTFGLLVQLVALGVLLAGFVLGDWALVENRFFSGMVRMQIDRGQQVVSGGPYRWVRHPGYAGALWSYLAMPLFLDAAWAFVPAVLLIIVLIVRTGLEDRALQDELPGYRDYAAQVRYRLLPGIW